MTSLIMATRSKVLSSQVLVFRNIHGGNFRPNIFVGGLPLNHGPKLLCPQPILESKKDFLIKEPGSVFHIQQVRFLQYKDFGHKREKTPWVTWAWYLILCGTMLYLVGGDVPGM